MSSVASRRVTKGPEKGVFPLDHFGECKEIADKYLLCLENEEGEAVKCKNLVKLCLQCRMERQLMAKADMNSFGIDPVKEPEGKQ